MMCHCKGLRPLFPWTPRLSAIRGAGACDAAGGVMIHGAEWADKAWLGGCVFYGKEASGVDRSSVSVSLASHLAAASPFTVPKSSAAALNTGMK